MEKFCEIIENKIREIANRREYPLSNEEMEFLVQDKLERIAEWLIEKIDKEA